MNLPAAWEQLLEPEEPRPATREQRIALYRCGYTKTLVKSLTTKEASELIQIALRARERGPV